MELQFLYELQQQEINHNKLLSKIAAISEDNQMTRLKDEYKKLKEEYAAISEKKEEIERQICEKKTHCISLEASKESYEKLIYTPEINNVKKLETLKKQIDDVQKCIDSEKNCVEKLYSSLSIMENQVTGVKKKIIFIKKKYNSTKANKEEELSFLLNEKEHIEEMIKDIKLNVDEDLYNEYMKMKERLINPISEIDNRKCSGCSMEVPAMDYEAVKAGNSLKCQSCGRILVYKRNK